MNAIGKPITKGLLYRRSVYDKWEVYIPNTPITLDEEGDYVQFRNFYDKLSVYENSYVQFSLTGQIKGFGNVQSLLNFSEATDDYCFYKLFENCTALVQTPLLQGVT